MNARLIPEDWLDGDALDGYESDAELRAWLRTPGLLTERIRAAAGERYALRVLHEAAPGAAFGGGAVIDAGVVAHLRAIELGERDAPWIYAETSVPAATLEAHPWLARIGDMSIGERFQQRGGVTRSAFEFARLSPDRPFVARALARTHAPSRPLWVRRSRFSVAGSPLELLEAFLPALSGKRAP